MNKKGFTLVEILAVIVILGLIMVIVSTKGFGAFDNTKSKITELNNKAINEGLELLKIDIEHCNDDLDEDVYKDIFGKNSCDELDNAISVSTEITLDKLINKGYIASKDVSEIENPSSEKIKISKTDNKISFEYDFSKEENENNDEIIEEENENKDEINEGENKEEVVVLKKAVLKATIKDSQDDFYKYKDSIVEVYFVKHINKSNAIEEWDVSDNTSETPVYAWIENSTETGKYILYVGSESTIYANPDSSYMFYNFVSLKSINFDNFNTTQVTNMSYMFYICRVLTELNLRIFNTSNVQNMKFMFAGCNALTKLNIENFNTSNVTNYSYMFFATDLKLICYTPSNIKTEIINMIPDTVTLSCS